MPDVDVALYENAQAAWQSATGANKQTIKDEAVKVMRSVYKRKVWKT